MNNFLAVYECGQIAVFLQCLQGVTCSLRDLLTIGRRWATTDHISSRCMRYTFRIRGVCQARSYPLKIHTNEHLARHEQH